MTYHSRMASDESELLTSRENRWLKRFRGALRGSGPAESDPIGVEGPKLVEDALRSGLQAEALLVSESAEPALDTILRAASASESGIPRSRILRTSDKLFASVAGTETPQGVAALFRAPEWEFEDILRGAADENGARSGASPLVVVMVGVQDPGNVGTIVRSAEAFGATGAIAARGTADPWSPKALRASAVSALRLPLLRGIAIPVLLAQLKMAQVKIVATSGRGLDSSQAGSRESSFYPDLREPSAIFVGNEGTGLAREVLQSADAAISIPMRPAVDSLNAGVAASIALFEAARQRSSAE
jgi:RNA methyltransferase, TrmH family